MSTDHLLWVSALGMVIGAVPVIIVRVLHHQTWAKSTYERVREAAEKIQREYPDRSPLDIGHVEAVVEREEPPRALER